MSSDVTRAVVAPLLDPPDSRPHNAGSALVFGRLAEQIVRHIEAHRAARRHAVL
jgi:hypothetical protein